MMQIRFFLLILFGAGEASPCLPDSIAVRDRKNLRNADGQLFPVGFIVPDWSSAKLTSAIMEILAGEILGYLIRVNDVAPASSIPGMYALLGCATWTNASDRGCSTRKVRDHVLVDSWYTSFQPVVAAINEQYEGEAPVVGGAMGYLGFAGTFIPRSVLEAGDAEGKALEYYKSYDARWHEPWKYYDGISSFNISADFMPCAESVLSDSSLIQNYLEISGDAAGVVVTGSSYKALCEDGYTWMSPACRSSTREECLVHITGGDGWDLQAGMQRAAVFNMPVIIGVAASWAKYVELPERFKTMFYWWTPDDTFVHLDSQSYVVPARDALAQSKGDRTSSGEASEVAKVLSADLESMAPDLVQLLQKSQMQLDDVNDLMRTFKGNASASRHDVACQWLQENKDRWQSWLPDPTRCSPGHGLHDGTDFIATRSGAISCQKCPPGTYSKAFSDGELTYVCSPCDPGSYQEFGTSLSCLPCQRGEYQDLPGSRSCQRCGIGFYQHVVGQSQCLKCPATTTTLGIGSMAAEDCGCKEGTINMEVQGLRCVACGEGLTCPFSSSIAGLLSGNSTLGPDFVPQLLQGYASSEAKPLSVHKCMSNCPGGKPGTCAPGLRGRTCAECPVGQTWTGETCTECRVEVVIAWILVALLVLCGLLWSYHFVNSAQQQQVSIVEAWAMSFSLAAYMLQNVGVVGLMTVRWTPTFSNTTSMLSIFLLDFKSLSMSCVTGVGDLTDFAATAAIFPFCSLWILGRWALRAPCFSPWRFFMTLNTVGVLLQVGFTSMVTVAVKPVMCYRHPNGLYSIVEYPSVVCGESVQVTMMIIGFVLLAFAAGFLALCVYAAVAIPKWSLQQRDEFAQAFRFLTGKFRLSSWWFGLVLLARSLSFSLAVALFSNTPDMQAAIGSVVLLVYLGWLIAMWPWKLPVLNYVDAAVTGSLLLLMGHAQQEGRTETDFVEGLSVALLLVIFISIALLVCFNIMALMASRKKRARRLLNVGANISSRDVAQALTACAAELMHLEVSHLEEMCAELHSVDLKSIGTAVTIISMELTSNPARHSSFSRRVPSRLLASRGASARASAAAAPSPDTAVAVPPQFASDLAAAPKDAFDVLSVTSESVAVIKEEL